MNLITDAWIPIIRQDGTREKIAPWQIAEKENPVVEINAPRADFQGALFQFLIGVLQTCFAPEDEEKWEDSWDSPPYPETLKSIFDNLSSAFELISETGPSFLQEQGLTHNKFESISQLFIGEPGNNTTKKNQDLFIHRGNKSSICETCCASAMYTLSLNCPPGGAGHMAGLIGNGPFFTLLKDHDNTLWHNLWLNVLSQEDSFEIISGPNSEVFPWLEPTKTSESCTTKGCPNGCSKCSTFPDDKNPLHSYWGMSRRILLCQPSGEGLCDICGSESSNLFQQYITRPNGFRYVGGWQYSLSPRKFTDREKPMEPLKGNQVKNCYSDWLGLMYADDSKSVRSSITIKTFFNDRAYKLTHRQIRVHCYGYDMEPGQAKARCWNESQYPILLIDKLYRDNFVHFVSQLIDSTEDVSKEVVKQVKAAWFSRPKDAKGDTSMVDQSFWQSTEAAFYRQLNILAKQAVDTRHMPPTVAEQWLKILRKTAYELFDQWVLEGDPEDMNMKRITRARADLSKNLKSIKSLQALEQWASAEQKESV